MRHTKKGLDQPLAGMAWPPQINFEFRNSNFTIIVCEFVPDGQGLRRAYHPLFREDERFPVLLLDSRHIQYRNARDL